jgi:hypothetical protein
MTLGFLTVRTSTIATLLLLSGCTAAGGLNLPFSDAGAKATAAPAEDACGTPKDCAVHLKKLVNNPNRDWIGQPQSPDAYANGTRLFAYRVLRKRLTCDELQRAVEDTKAASFSLFSLQEARYERARPLVAQVTKELSAEQTKRCPGRS